MTKLEQLTQIRDRLSGEGLRLTHEIEAYAAALAEIDPDGTRAQAEPEGPAGELASRLSALQTRLAYVTEQAGAFDRAWQKEPKPAPEPGEKETVVIDEAELGRLREEG